MVIAHYRFIFIIALFCFFTINISSQVSRTTFKGKVVDEADQPIPGVTLMVLHPADSVLAKFSSSDVEGNFMIKNTPKGDYLLNFAFLGMEPIYMPVTSGNVEEQDLGKIKMLPASTLLNEVQVTADIIPIEIKKDTISYNAEAFQTQPNAVVEDLLKKLPGIEVQTDGSIKAQGETVEKVLVDGKEFFGTDPKMATKNLPARAIKKVKVYDKKSDIAEFTGVDDGEREKTIDLQLKEEFKKGLFGKVEGGYGSDEKYKASASLNRFSKTSQLSFLGQFNNINEQGFSFQDQMNFSGNSGGFSGGGRGEIRSMSADGFSFESPSTGLINTAAGGLNFTWQKSKKFNLRTSYFYNEVDNTLIQDVFRQNLFDVPFDTDRHTDELKGTSTHRFSLASEIKPDSVNEINFNGRISVGNGKTMNENVLETTIPGNPIQSRANTMTDKTNDNLAYSSNLTYVRRFGNKGQNIAATFNLNKTDNDNESTLQSLTEYFTTGNIEALDQLQYTISDNLNWGGQASFTQPLKKRRFLEAAYYYNQVDADYNKRVSDIFNSEPVENPELSSTYSSVYKYHRPGVTFRYSGETQNLNIGLQYQISELAGIESKENTGITKQYQHLLPRIIWRNDIGNGKNMRMSYTTRTNSPSITQLSPVVDNSDPTSLYVGNPDLNAEYSHYLNMNFHSFTQFSSTSFFASLSGTLTTDKIITSRTSDEQLIELSKPVNIGKETQYNIYTSFGRPLNFIHSRFNINANATFTKTQSLIDLDLLDLNRWTRSAGISINNLNSKVLEYGLGTQWSFTDNYYTTDASLDQNTLLQNYFIDITLTIWKKWKLNGNYNYNLYSSDQFATDQSLALMKASISRFILSKDRGQVILSVFDALDENRGLSRSSQVNYIEEIRSNSIGRYFMLSFVYNLRGAGEEPPGAVRMGPRR